MRKLASVTAALSGLLLGGCMSVTEYVGQERDGGFREYDSGTAPDDPPDAARRLLQEE